MGVLLVRVQCPPYQKERDRMSVPDTQVMRAERGGKGVLGYGGMSLSVDSSHKAVLLSLPLESMYCDRAA